MVISSLPAPRVSPVIIDRPSLASHTMRTIKKNMTLGCEVRVLVTPIVKNPLILKNSRRITSIMMWCHKLVRASTRNTISRGRIIRRVSIYLLPATFKVIKIREKNKIIAGL